MKKVVFVYEQQFHNFQIAVQERTDGVFDRLHYRVDQWGRVTLSDAGTSIARFLQDGYSVDIQFTPIEGGAHGPV